MFGLKYKDQLGVKKLIAGSLEKEKPSKINADKETTTKQQLLILYYMGILDHIDIEETTKKAKLISFLLNRNKQNVREAITYINEKAKRSDIKTVENLNAILPIIQEVGLNKVADKIIADLMELKAD